MRRLHGSTPFRLAMLFSLAVLATFALASLVAALLIGRDLRARQDEVLLSRYDAMAQAFASGGPEALVAVAAVSAHADGGVRESLVSLTDARGTVLTGDGALQAVHDGLSTHPGHALGIDTDHGYRLLARRVERYRLVLGVINQASEEIRDIGLAALGWASLLVLLIASVGAVVVARSLRRAVGVVGDTLRRVATGHFDARVSATAFGRVRGADVTALVEELNATLAQLERGVDSVRQVTADIAHDLRTPLSRVRIRLEGALENCPPGDAVASAVELSLADLGQLDATFSALLRTAEIESGARRARFRVFDAGALFGQIADVYREVAEDAGDELVVVRSGHAPTLVDGDRDLLAQLFVNLIENALRHCSSGSIIRCELVTGPDAIEFVVADDGDGIPAEERQNVLKRLYRLEKSRTSPGSGLGLSLVKAIADLHEGTLVLADNAPGLRVSLMLRPARGGGGPAQPVAVPESVHS